MKQLVLDANQVGDFCKRTETIPRGYDALLLNPFVFAELLLRNRPAWIRHLTRFPLRFGVQPAEVMQKIAASDAEAIRAYTPFYSPDEDRSLAERVTWVTRITPELLDEARRTKRNNLSFSHGMLARSPAARASLADASGGRMAKERDPVAFMRSMWQPERCAWIIVLHVTNDGQRDTAISQDELVRAVMDNRYLSRLFAMQLFYMNCVTQLWSEQMLNVLQPKDDWSDMTNALYADAGDVIVT